MIIAALIVFGSLLVAWLFAPSQPRPSTADPQLAPLEGLPEAA
jgi:hypothetical protein